MGAAKLQILHIRRRTAQPHSLSPPIFTVCQVLEESPYASLASTTIFRIRKNSDVRNRSRILCKTKATSSRGIAAIYIYIYIGPSFQQKQPEESVVVHAKQHEYGTNRINYRQCECKVTLCATEVQWKKRSFVHQSLQ